MTYPSKSDPDYLSLKAKGRRVVGIRADQAISLMDLLFDRDAALEASEAARQSAEAKLEAVREALAFYADQDRWGDYWRDALAAAHDRNGGSELGDDEGEKARQALASLDKEKAGG